jgi:hypothetical protein
MIQLLDPSGPTVVIYSNFFPKKIEKLENGSRSSTGCLSLVAPQQRTGDLAPPPCPLEEDLFQLIS